VFRISGLIKKPLSVIRFSRVVAALKAEDALERIYSEMGSRHKVRRKQLIIEKVEKVLPGEGP